MKHDHDDLVVLRVNHLLLYFDSLILMFLELPSECKEQLWNELTTFQSSNTC